MLPPEAGRDGAFLERIVYRITMRSDGDGRQLKAVGAIRNGVCYLRRTKELLEHDVHSSQHLGQEEIFAGFVQRALFALIPAPLAGEPETLRRRSRRGCGYGGGG